jgi:two-component system sensor histidine kinase/response regulator
MRATNRPHILIVDDYADTAEMLALVLRRAGYETTIALSAVEAVKLAEATQFDLVLSDIAMPVMNGYELVTALRKRRDYRSTPIVAVTGLAMHDDRERSIRAGFNAHLTKPINPATLTHQIGRLLRK